MRYTILALFSVLILAACGKDNDVKVVDAYAFETPRTMPTAAVFMTIRNDSDMLDQLIDFKIDNVGRTELHIMEMTNDIMKMRRVDRFDIQAGESFALTPSGPHIMVFDMSEGFTTGKNVKATAVFEKAGEIPVNIDVRTRDPQSSGHNH